MSLDFYYAPFSSASRVHWALEELGIPYNKIKMDLKAGETRSPAYVAMNPNAKVPLLVIDGKPLFESLAILLYLGEHFGPEKNLWPAANDPARFEALSWTTWGTTELGMAIAMLFNFQEVPPAKELAIARSNACCAILERHLEGRPYVMGNDFTLVDVAVSAVLAWSRFFNYDLTPFPRVSAWVDRCSSRPALKATQVG
ncbi:glutathione S-transferase family protein [Pendulispora rubella]|uniref:Glutathione S-transferase family protein n=2 Tax=Pendulispora rubella TaxID=2741070 RepID=A0ABZ2LAE6_9BACT